jgi:hypothetical protein
MFYRGGNVLHLLPPSEAIDLHILHKNSADKEEFCFAVSSVNTPHILSKKSNVLGHPLCLCLTKAMIKITPPRNYPIDYLIQESKVHLLYYTAVKICDKYIATN